MECCSMPTLDGSVENIVFRNEDNHYTVARFRLNDSGRLFRDDLTTIVGMLPGIQVGELLSIEGEWEKDPRYGRQLHVTSFVQRLPASLEGITRYLSSGLIKGIGPKKAKLIVEHFGLQTLAIMEQQPERLSEVKGIGARDREQIIKTWAEQSEIKELHLFLQSHNVSMNIATRIYKQYGKDAIKVIRENPYQLAQDVHGIGFRIADDIAVKLGLPADSVPRLATGLKYVLAQAANEDGHCFLPEGELLTRAASLLRILLHSSTSLPPASQQLWDTVFTRLAQNGNMHLTEKQREAVQTAYSKKVSILTGGPGTGKSTSIRALLMLLQKRKIDVALAAPTGRAAKRLSEATGALGTGVQAKTLHRLLEYSPHDNTYQRNEENPLPYQFVIV